LENVIKILILIFLSFLVIFLGELLRSIIKKDFSLFGNKTNFELLPPWFLSFSVFIIPVLIALFILQILKIVFSLFYG